MLVYWSIYTWSYGTIASIMVIKIWLKLKQTRQPFSFKTYASPSFYILLLYFIFLRKYSWSWWNFVQVFCMILRFNWSYFTMTPPFPSVKLLPLVKLTVFCNKCRIHLIELYTVLFQTLALPLKQNVLTAL